MVDCLRCAALRSAMTFAKVDKCWEHQSEATRLWLVLDALPSNVHVNLSPQDLALLRAR
jgi:hypothetical protein